MKKHLTNLVADLDILEGRWIIKLGGKEKEERRDPQLNSVATANGCLILWTQEEKRNEEDASI